jgi:germination protein M
MKKRAYVQIIAYLIILCLIPACKNSDDDTYDDGQVYLVSCLDREENKLLDYEYHTEAVDRDELIRQLIEEMSRPSEDVKRRECIKEYTVTDYDIDGTLLTLHVDEAYKNMQPTTEVLVRAALVRTLGQVDGIKSVSVKVGTEELLDALGSPVGSMSPALFVDNPGDEINAYDSIDLVLYYASEDGGALKKCVRKVEYNTSISVEKLVVEQIIQGVSSDESATGIKNSVNPQTSIINVTVKDGICYVNLNNGFLILPEGVRPEVIIYSIVDSLVELPGVSKVSISIDGSSDAILGETMPLSTLYERNLDLVIP